MTVKPVKKQSDQFNITVDDLISEAKKVPSAPQPTVGALTAQPTPQPVSSSLQAPRTVGAVQPQTAMPSIQAAPLVTPQKLTSQQEAIPGLKETLAETTALAEERTQALVGALEPEQERQRQAAKRDIFGKGAAGTVQDATTQQIFANLREDEVRQVAGIVAQQQGIAFDQAMQLVQMKQQQANIEREFGLKEQQFGLQSERQQAELAEMAKQSGRADLALQLEQKRLDLANEAQIAELTEMAKQSGRADIALQLEKDQFDFKQNQYLQEVEREERAQRLDLATNIFNQVRQGTLSPEALTPEQVELLGLPEGTKITTDRMNQFETEALQGGYITADGKADVQSYLRNYERDEFIQGYIDSLDKPEDYDPDELNKWLSLEGMELIGEEEIIEKNNQLERNLEVKDVNIGSFNPFDDKVTEMLRSWGFDHSKAGNISGAQELIKLKALEDKLSKQPPYYTVERDNIELQISALKKQISGIENIKKFDDLYKNNTKFRDAINKLKVLKQEEISSFGRV